MDLRKKIEKLKGVSKESAKKIASGELKVGDPEYERYIKNQIVVLRKLVIHQFKGVEELHSIRQRYNSAYKEYEKSNNVVAKAEVYLDICELNDLVKERLNLIADCGEELIRMLSLDILAEHDVCQLLNINWKTFQDEKQKYIKSFGKEEHLLYSIISVCGPEYRDRKGRIKEAYDCPRYEMPVYWAIHETIMREMRTNKTFKEATNEKLKELFPGLKTYRAITDLEGNIIKVVEDKRCNDDGKSR